MISFVFDTETTGLIPRDLYGVLKPYTETKLYENSRLVQVAWILCEQHDVVIKRSFIVKPDSFEIPEASTKIHGISHEHALEEGHNISDVFAQLYRDMTAYVPRRIVAHNLEFDLNIILSELHRLRETNLEHQALSAIFTGTPQICTMLLGRNICKIPKENNRFGYKNPKLTELYEHYFGHEMVGNHDAMADTEACFSVTLR